MLTKNFYFSKKINIKARLLSSNKALFYKQFHENDINNDTFYKLIKKRCEEHIILSKISPELFKFPYDQTGFVFKCDQKTIQCTNWLFKVTDLQTSL